MLLMAIAAAHAAFRDFMVKGSGELRANFSMTLVA